jgi:Cu/Ag efflux pump CusA
VTATAELVPAERIQSRILVLRGLRVLLDADLAAIYEVPTSQLNQAVKRNLSRFPDDFMFQLTKEEAELVRSRSRSVTLNKLKSQTVTSKRGQNIKYLPFAFTEHGAVQLSNILRSDRAIEMGIAVVRAFVQLRALMADHKTLRAKLAELDARVGAHDEQLAAIVEAIRELAVPVESPNKRKIGYHVGTR